MEELIQQTLGGIATGAIYACIALAVVMIYQAIDHFNFAQGEMAMFSAFLETGKSYYPFRFKNFPNLASMWFFRS